jgi:hypothetical protein
MLPTHNMQTKTALIMSLIAASMVIALATILATPALAEPKEKTTTKILSTADNAIHNSQQGTGFVIKADIEFHTGTGQAGFCVSNFCPPR